jgi:hypothetical protein
MLRRILRRRRQHRRFHERQQAARADSSRLDHAERRSRSHRTPAGGLQTVGRRADIDESNPRAACLDMAGERGQWCQGSSRHVSLSATEGRPSRYCAGILERTHLRCPIQQWTVPADERRSPTPGDRGRTSTEGCQTKLQHSHSDSGTGGHPRPRRSSSTSAALVGTLKGHRRPDRLQRWSRGRPTTVPIL